MDESTRKLSDQNGRNFSYTYYYIILCCFYDCETINLEFGTGITLYIRKHIILNDKTSHVHF